MFKHKNYLTSIIFYDRIIRIFYNNRFWHYQNDDQDFIHLDHFDGANFTRWKDKLKFRLTALKNFSILDPNLTPIPPPNDDDSNESNCSEKEKRERQSCV